MKRLKWSLALAASLWLGSTTAEAAGIIASEEQPVYDTTTHEQIGTIEPNVYYETVREEENHIVVEVETATGYVRRTEQIETADASMQPVNDKQRVMVTTEETVFYTTDRFTQPFYTAVADRRFIVVGETEQSYEVQLFGQVAYVKKEQLQLDRGVPVLLYHHLLRDSENENYANNATVDPLTFIFHMEYVKDLGYNTITLDDLYGYINGTQNISAKSFALTFDDGLTTTRHYAYPLLQAFDFKATNFIITSRTPSRPQPFDPSRLQFLSLQEMDDMRDVFTFEGHTHNMHRFAIGSCGALVCEPLPLVKQDLETSLAVFPHDYFAYPFGQYNDHTIDVLKEIGIKMAFTTRKDYVQLGDDVYRVPRIDVQRSMTFPQFKALFDAQ